MEKTMSCPSRAPLKDGDFRLDINGISHWCRIAGAGNLTVPIVVVHGGPGGHLYNFERTIGPLLEEFATVIYYEQRGSGRTDPPGRPDDYSIPILVDDLERLCGTLELGRVVLLGFSFGGQLALEYTLAHPARVERLILQAPTIDDQKRIAYVQLFGFKTVAEGEMGAMVQRYIDDGTTPEDQLEKVWDAVDTETVDRFLFHSPEAARMNRMLWEASGLVNTEDMRQALLTQKRLGPELLHRINAINVPSLVLGGLYDRNVGLEICRDIHSRLRDSRLVVFQESAHFPDIEETEKYAAEVRGFLSEG